jgi:rubrerythrin
MCPAATRTQIAPLIVIYLAATGGISGQTKPCPKYVVFQAVSRLLLTAFFMEQTAIQIYNLFYETKQSI